MEVITGTAAEILRLWFGEPPTAEQRALQELRIRWRLRRQLWGIALAYPKSWRPGGLAVANEAVRASIRRVRETRA